MAVALYARKSVERENSISCETQIEYCRAMIKPDERDEKVIEYIDNGSAALLYTPAQKQQADEIYQALLTKGGD